MTNYEWQLQKFVMQHPEYAEELKVGNLGMNVFCDILRREPKGIIAESNLPHEIELAGSRMVSARVVIKPQKDDLVKSPDKIGHPAKNVDVEL